MAEAFLNYWAILAAAVVHFLVGGLWYSPLLFAKPWMNAMKYTEKSMKNMQETGKSAMLKSTILSLIMAYVLAHFVDLAGATSVSGALQLAFWLWLGFIIPVQYQSVLFENKSKIAFLIGAGYQFVALVAMSLILTLWI